MEFKRFNKNNCFAQRHFEPAISLNLKSGTISFNKGLVELMSLQLGTKIVVLQNEETPKDWFLLITKRDAGFVIRGQVNAKYTTLFFRSRYLVHKMIESIKPDKTGTILCLVAKHPIDNGGEHLWPIITSSAR